MGSGESTTGDLAAGVPVGAAGGESGVPVGEVLMIGTVSVGSGPKTRRRFKSAVTGTVSPAATGLLAGGVAGAVGAVCGVVKKETEAATALDCVLTRFASVDGDSCDGL